VVVRHTLVYAVGLLLCLAPTADASKLHLIAPSSTSFASDGTRYAAWQVSEGSPITVFDTRTWHRAEVTAPGCRLLDQGGHQGGSHDEGRRGADGRFLVSCAPRTQGLLDVGTGTITTLPTPMGEFGPSWVVMGSRYVEGSDAKDKCRHTAGEVSPQYCLALYDIATGAVSYRAQSQVGDLDRPGAPPVCPRLRGKLIELGRAAYSNGVFAEATEPMRIYRCRGRPTLLPDPGETWDVELGAGLLTWDTAYRLTAFQGDVSNPGFRRGILESYRLSSGRRRSFKLPVLAALAAEGRVVHIVSGYATHTANTVFWIATRKLEPTVVGYQAGDGSAVYAARL
jgi:hypothetical protein